MIEVIDTLNLGDKITQKEYRYERTWLEFFMMKPKRKIEYMACYIVTAVARSGEAK